MNAILADSPVSFYHQLYTILRKELARGVWKPGDRMPSEAELIAAYGVSRITVRQAFDLLVNDGLVYRRRGSGTFVTAPPIELGLNRIVSFTEDMRRRGMHPETQLLDARLEPAADEIALRLDVEPGAELAVLERLRLADGVPMGIERSRLVHRLCPGVLDGDYAHTSLHATLLERYGIRLARANQAIRVMAADSALAGKLSVPTGAPMFYIERVAFGQAGIPVEYLEIYQRGDRYVLYNELRA
jgi:GntR family transcriptional regulator